MRGIRQRGNRGLGVVGGAGQPRHSISTRTFQRPFWIRLAAISIAVLCVAVVGPGRAIGVRAAGTADISVTLTGPASVNEGEDAVFTAAIQNAGPDPATGVVLAGFAPYQASSQLAFDPSQSSSGCTVSSGRVTCALNQDIASGSQAAVQIAFRTIMTGTFTDSVSVSETATDPTPADDSASATATVGAPVSADLTVSWQGYAAVAQGAAFAPGLLITNNGPDTSPGFSLSITLPPGVTSNTPGCISSGAGGTCTYDRSNDREQPGTAEFWHLYLALTTNATGPLTLSATVTGTLSDPDSSNNTATTTFEVTRSADMSVSLACCGISGQPTPGQPFYVFVNDIDHGPSASTGSTVTLNVPAGITPGFSGCSASANGDTCNLQVGSMPGGAGEDTILTFTAAGTGTYSFSAQVSGNDPDPNPSNNATSLAVTVAPAADLGVTLGWSGSPQQPYAGQPFDLVLGVSNGGPSPSTGGAVTVAVPAGLIPQFRGCVSSAGGWTCTVPVPNLPPHTGVEDMYQFTSTAAGQFTIGARVTGNEADPYPSNNSTSLTVTTQPAADLALTSSATPNPVVAGHQVTETVVLTNNGPSVATGMSWTTSWTSNAKGGIDVESYTASVGSCTLSGQTVTCAPGDLASGQQVVLTLVLQPRSKGTLTIDSSAASNTSDPNAANNSSTTIVQIS